MKTMLMTTTAVAALCLATPALAFSVWPDVDFEWYANVGQYDARAWEVVEPAPRPGFIWSPERWETRGERQVQIAAHWVADDYYEQLAIYNHPRTLADMR